MTCVRDGHTAEGYGPVRKFFFSSRRRHTRFDCDWSSDVCSSDLVRKRKSNVYRLEGVGQAGSAVIAKRCRTAVAQVERTVYEDILAGLPVASLRYYGFVDEPDAAFGWLFMEEAGGADYSNLLPEHRARAGRWLGLLHAAAAGVGARGRLPEIGRAHV